MQLAHISDLHVKAPLGPWWGLLNKRWIGAVTLMRRAHPQEILDAAVADLRRDAPDHLAVTGDLTNLALESEFTKAFASIQAAGLPPERLTVIPGNHDAYVRGPFRARRFEAHCAPLLGAPALEWPRAQRAGDVLFVSLSSAHPTPWFTAFGSVGREQLERARALLAQEAAFKVVLVHHPPVQSDGRRDWFFRRNLDGPAILDACREAGVGLLLCGHTHKAFRLKLDGPRAPLWVSCAGSTTKKPGALGAAAVYLRYRIDGRRLTSFETRGFCPERRAFVDLGREAV